MESDSLKTLVVRGIHFGEGLRNDQVDPQTPTIVYHIDQARDEQLGKALSQYNLNYIFDPVDERDRKYAATLKGPILTDFLPTKVDLRSNFGTILDQGPLGSCVANTVAYQLRYLLSISNQRNMDMSRLYLYYYGRLNAGYSTQQDTGLSIRQGIQGIPSYGVAAETLWPYLISRYTVAPPSTVTNIGILNKKLTYLAVNQTMDEFKKCLKDGFAISFGILLKESFMSAQVAQTGIVPIPLTNEPRVGGHAMTLVGYDDSKSAFLVANSWGSNWGQAGYCYIPYQIILDTSSCGDFWTIRGFTYTSSATPPTPTPTPSPTPAPAPAPVPVSAWVARKFYNVDERVTYLGQTYRCVISHFSIPQWTPNVVRALWAPV
jgi:hypothetical protein